MTDKRKHYVDNEAFFEEMKKWKNRVLDAREMECLRRQQRTSPHMSECCCINIRLGLYFSIEFDKMLNPPKNTTITKVSKFFFNNFTSRRCCCCCVLPRLFPISHRY